MRVNVCVWGNAAQLIMFCSVICFLQLSDHVCAQMVCVRVCSPVCACVRVSFVAIPFDNHALEQFKDNGVQFEQSL